MTRSSMNRLHPLSAVSYAVRYGFLWLSLSLFLVGALASISELLSGRWVPVAAVGGLAFGIGYGIAYYYRFGYRITDDTFDVASGVVARRSREIPYGRIQNVDIRQGVFQRLVGLAVVSIETAGGQSTEAALNFVSEAEATRLQNEIRRRTADGKRKAHSDDERDDSSVTDQEFIGPLPASEFDSDTPSSEHAGIGPGPGAGDRIHDRSPTEFEEPERKRLFDLEARELLLYSFTSFRPAAVAAVLFIFFFMTDTIIEYLLAIAQPLGGPADIETGTAGSYGILTIVSLVNGIIVTYLLSVAYAFGTYYGFQLGRIDDDFVYERGLLQRYSGSIPTGKVQSVTVTANPAQRLIGYAGLWVETAGYGPSSDSGSQSAVPLAERGRVYGFTERLTGVETPRFERPPPVARRRYLVRYSLVAAGLVAVAVGVTTVTILERWYLAGVVFAAVPVAAHLRYVNLGHYVGEEHLVVRRGFWKRRTTIIPYYRLQTANTRRSIFQRRLGIASVVVDTASSQSFSDAAPTIYDIELETAREVHATSRRRLQSALSERSQDDDLSLDVDFTDPDSSGP